MNDQPVITDHDYQGSIDGYCTYDYGDNEHVDFCTMPEAAHR